MTAKVSTQVAELERQLASVTSERDALKRQLKPPFSPHEAQRICQQVYEALTGRLGDPDSRRIVIPVPGEPRISSYRLGESMSEFLVGPTFRQVEVRW